MSESPKNLVELYLKSCETFASKPLFGTKKDGTWNWITFAQFKELVDRVRGALAASGIGPGDRVAIISDNRVEWAAVAYATYGREAAAVPMYQAQRASEWQFILADCGAKAAFVGTEKGFDAVQKMRESLPALTTVVGLDRPPGAADSFAAFLELGSKHPMPPRVPSPETIAGFIYTSGTTGKPKGVLLSHGN